MTDGAVVTLRLESADVALYELNRRRPRSIRRSHVFAQDRILSRSPITAGLTICRSSRGRSSIQSMSRATYRGSEALPTSYKRLGQRRAEPRWWWHVDMSIAGRTRSGRAGPTFFERGVAHETLSPLHGVA